MDLVATVLDGILLGGLYALFASGLSLIFGVMRLVNIAHGDLIVLSAFITLLVTARLGVHPLVSLVLVVPLMALLGYGLQRGIFNPTLGSDILRPVLVSFGLTVLLQNALLQIFSADSRRLQAGNLETLHIDLPGGIAVGVLPCLIFIVAFVVIGGLQLLLYHTELGRAFRSVSDDQETAQLMGINNAHLFGLAMALSLAIVSVAGVFLGIRTNFDPSIGPTRLIFDFEAVIIGGLGDLWGTFVGGVILGVAQTLGARINPGYQILAGHLVFLAVLTLRPQGFFAKLLKSHERSRSNRAQYPNQRPLCCLRASPPALSNQRSLLHGKIRIISLGRDLLLPCSGKPLEFAGWLYRTGFNRPAGFCRAWRLRALCVNDLLSDTADPGSTGCRHRCRVA
jgi:branched-chain amino acid transport system permease protein